MIDFPAEDDKKEYHLKEELNLVRQQSIRRTENQPEEKKDRKTNLKQARRERREEKKANSEAFNSEKIRQEKNIINDKNSLQGIKIY